MSRLESFMRRLMAQKDGLEWAAERIKNIAGDVLEIGLGNGRSYDHLREIVPERRIWVIDRVLQCFPSCTPPESDFLKGEAEDMLVKLKSAGAQIALAHYDFGVGVKEQDWPEAAMLSPLIADILTPKGIVISGQPLVGFARLDGPETITGDRYFCYQL